MNDYYNEYELKSNVSKRLKKQMLQSLVVFTVAYFAVLAIIYLIMTDFVWYADDPVYRILVFVKRFFFIFGVIPLMIGWYRIISRCFKKPFRFLDEIVNASEQLAKENGEQIILSGELKNIQDEFNKIRETSARDKKLAKEAEQRKNDMIVYLAHDLKTPLTSVIGYLTLLKDEKNISEELREKYLAISLGKAERLEDLINEFFDITRFNLTHIELQYTKVNMTRLMEQLIYEFAPVLNEKGQQCKLVAKPDITVRCDVNKMQRVFDNLLRNAAYYSFEGSEIEIRIVQNETETTIIFINHGDTIPKEKLARIFEQFYRLDSSRGTNKGGAGLGLAISKQITELHSGVITAESENEIIVFTVTLPNN